MPRALDPPCRLVIGRIYCATCQIVRAVVAHPDAIITCPHCGTRTVPAHGLDTLEADA